MTDLEVTFWLAIIAAIYFLPAIVARLVRHPQAGAIFVLNMFLGWTALGWIAALIWAFVTTERKTA